MKRFTIIAVCIILICAALLYYLSLPHNRAETAAARGELDLTGEDFSRDIYTLDGEWEIYYGELLTPEYFNSPQSTSNTQFIHVPMSWERAGYPLKGCATYRLTVFTDEAELLLRIPKITFSSIVWINGEKVFEAGRPGLTQEETIPRIRTAFVNIRPQNGRLEIIAQAASYNWFVAGLRNGWELGRPGIVVNDAVIRYALLAVCLGAMTVLALYHLVLFFYRRNEWVYLAFALTVLNYTLRHFMETNGFVQLLLPGGMGEGVMRLYLVTLILQPTLLVFFTHAAFMMPLKGKLKCAVYVLCAAVPTVIALVIPNALIYVDSYLFIILVPLIWTAISAALTLVKQFNAYNLLYLIAIMMFIIWYPVQKLAFDDQLFMVGIPSYLFLALSQCVMLVVSYADAKRREEELSAQTDFYRKMSHNLRTPLTVVSTNIQTARRRPQEAYALLEDSQAEIMKMASMIDTALSGDSMEKTDDKDDSLR